jgi:hypothetical protein
MLIEYSAAKFAVGSNQGRRLVPFRRHFAAVDCIVGNPCPDSNVGLPNNKSPAEIFNDFYQLGDSAVSFGMLFNGQTQQLPFGSVSVGNQWDPGGGGILGDAFPTATSEFVPPALIVDLAIRKDVSYYQRIHHAGYEIYSSSPSALITAGGIETDYAYKISGEGIPTVGWGNDNLGAGVPTTVMFTGFPPVTDFGLGPAGGLSRMTIDAFMSFYGKSRTEGDATNFTDNLCVWRNFACGLNFRMPSDLLACLDHDFQPGPNWFFIDSTACDGYKSGPKFFVVIFLICPQDGACKVLTAGNTAGFLEIVDDPADSIAVVKATVLANNPATSLGNLGPGCLTGGDCTGHYHSVSGHDLELALRGHQDDSNKTGITSVDGVVEKDLDQWNRAEGDIINSQSGGIASGPVISIKNPYLSTQLILDFSEPGHPCRRTGPSEPCKQWPNG